jgi:serine O-acetyltransferase
MRSVVVGWLDRPAGRLLGALEQGRSVLTMPMTWCYRLTDQQELIDADVNQWLEVLGVNDGEHGLHSLLYAFTEFRALFYFRLDHGNYTGALAGKLLRHWWKPTPGLNLQSKEIGPGLFIAHGEGTTLAAERIGRNCYVHHGVTVGWDYRSLRTPVIGDGVMIGTGAAVLGEVTVGDGARIGANAVVLCDVPPGGTAVGVPARVVATPVGLSRLHLEDDLVG